MAQPSAAQRRLWPWSEQSCESTLRTGRNGTCALLEDARPRRDSNLSFTSLPIVVGLELAGAAATGEISAPSAPSNSALRQQCTCRLVLSWPAQKGPAQARPSCWLSIATRVQCCPPAPRRPRRVDAASLMTILPPMFTSSQTRSPRFAARWPDSLASVMCHVRVLPASVSSSGGTAFRLTRVALGLFLSDRPRARRQGVADCGEVDFCHPTRPAPDGAIAQRCCLAN